MPLDSRPDRPGHLSVGFIIGIAACSLVALVALAAISASGAVSAGIGLTLALLPIPVLLAAVLYLDRLEPEPPGHLVFVFLWGAGAAALPGLIGLAAGAQLLTTPTLRLDGFATETAVATVGIAVLEETLKGAVLIVLLWRLPQELDGTSDGVVYGSMVGLGFALIENIFYYTQAAHNGFSGVAATFLLRGIVSPLWQAVFSSLIGIGVAYAAMSPKGRGLWAIGVGWVAAVTLHALWNAALSSSLARLAIFYAFMVVVFAAVLVAVVMDRRRIVSAAAPLSPPVRADRCDHRPRHRDAGQPAGPAPGPAVGAAARRAGRAARDVGVPAGRHRTGPAAPPGRAGPGGRRCVRPAARRAAGRDAGLHDDRPGPAGRPAAAAVGGGTARRASGPPGYRRSARRPSRVSPVARP